MGVHLVGEDVCTTGLYADRVAEELKQPEPKKSRIDAFLTLLWDTVKVIATAVGVTPATLVTTEVYQTLERALATDDQVVECVETDQGLSPSVNRPDGPVAPLGPTRGSPVIDATAGAPPLPDEVDQANGAPPLPDEVDQANGVLPMLDDVDQRRLNELRGKYLSRINEVDRPAGPELDLPGP